MAKEKEITKIHIDKELKESPNPITGAALYILGSIDPSEYDLYKKIPGKDDDLIGNDNTEYELKSGDHFYSAQKDLNPGNGRK
jgi:hypothetical protein